ncbi:Coenzyme F420 hydrogenase/dehydrogenase, beta subunit C-terminal domain [bacterium]|nr:Coenzyme F420 hydrogenase/dehydrogenase, beta subunit C-terminal domain [bacterium]
MKFEPKLSFDFLQVEVIDKGICGRCGGCVSFCTADRIGALEIGKDGFPGYSNKEACLECGLCYLICPQTINLNDDVKAKFQWNAPIGHVKDVFSLRATDKKIHEAATDGGVVTALLIDMLNRGLIDGAVVSKRTGLFNRESVVATTPQELLEAAGSFFAEAPHLEEVGSGYSSCVPLVKTIREYSKKRLSKLAVVGTPCQINAVRKMQVLNILPSDIIEFTVGLFCMQCFSMERLIDSHFMEAHNIDLKNVKKMNVKEDFYLHMDTGEVVHIPLEEVESIARPACLACLDFSNDFADISVGGLGSPEGYTTVLVRTITGKKRIADTMYSGAVEHLSGSNIQKLTSEKERILSLVGKFAEKKVRRGTANLEMLK